MATAKQKAAAKKGRAAARRRNKQFSLIDAGASLIVLDGWTRATVGSSLGEFLFGGWFGASQPERGSFGISLNEIVRNFLPGSSGRFGASAAAWAGSVDRDPGLMGIVKYNFQHQNNGINAIGRTIVVPLAATFLKRIGRKQIRQVNNILDRFQISQSFGGKL